MLRVSTTVPKRRLRNPLIWAALLSFAAHSVFFVTTQEFAHTKEKKTYSPIHVAIVRKDAPPAPKPVEKPKVTPKPKPPEPKPKPEPKPEEAKPQPIEEPKPQPQPEQAKPIFGVTADSLGAGDSNVAVRVGNTLAKDMDKNYINPNNVPKPVAAPPEEKKTRLVPVYELSEQPSFKDRPTPVYPEAARRAEIEGVVELLVWIDESGKVLKVKVAKGLGYGLDEAAVAAVKAARFNPGKRGAEAVAVGPVRIPFRFVLEE